MGKTTYDSLTQSGKSTAHRARSVRRSVSTRGTFFAAKMKKRLQERAATAKRDVHDRMAQSVPLIQSRGSWVYPTGPVQERLTCVETRRL